MINIEEAKKELVRHVNEQKIDNQRVPRKLGHIMRVATNSRKIATNLKLEEEKIQLAELIGILHDIGRFKQYQAFDKSVSSIMLDTTQKFNHGEARSRSFKRKSVY